MTNRAALLLVLAACGGSAEQASPPATPAAPAAPAVTTSEPAAPPATAPAPAASADPDPAGAGLDELGARAAGFIDAFTNAEPILTRDGKKVVFVSNRDGLPQLYIADAGKPTSTATRLVEWPERVTNLDTTPDGASLIFASDKGADENWAFYRVGLDGKDVVPLTPGEPLNRNAYLIPDGAPDTLYFDARKMAEPATTLYAASIKTPGAPRAIYTDPMPLFLEDVTRDGKRAVALRYPRRLENHVLVVDTATGEAKQIYPASGEVTVFGAGFSSDDKTVFVATDGGAEQALVLALDPTTGKERARYVETRPTTASLSLLVSKKRGLVAVGVQAGEHSEIRLLDEKTLKPKKAVAMPLGSGGLSTFSEDGRTLTVTWSKPDLPGDVYAIDTASGKVRRLRDEPRPSLGKPPAIDASIVQVDAFDGGKIPVNVYRPTGADAAPRPVIVSYHGGPSGVSTIRWNPGIAYFLSLGYVYVEPNVRGSSGFGRAYEAADNGAHRLDAFKDIEASARWVAAQPWADKQRLVILGGSYGGYTTLIALSRWPDLWRAGVDLFGVVNLATFMKSTSGVIRQLFLTEFGDPDKDAAFLASISPLTDVDKIRVPTFVYAGANDPRVPRSESDLIVKALRSRQLQVEYMVAANEGHSLARRPNQIEFYARVARFLDKHLK